MKKYLFETVKYALRSYPIIRPYIKEVESLYAMSTDALNQRNEKRFLDIFRRAYDKSPFYHRLYTQAGIHKEDITCLADINKLPVITKEMVKQHADEMLTVPRWKVIVANTSGTTGTPLRIYESWSAIWLKYAYLYCSRKNYGFRMGQRLVSLRGHLDKQIPCIKVHVSNTLYLSSYNINKATVRQYYERIMEFKPIAIEGYPSSLYSLALFLRDEGLSLNIPIAFTSSETLFDHQRELIESQLGTEIFDLYGMTEGTISLEESIHHDGYYERPGFSINEYLEDGEICTSLISSAFPMIRYRSNDIIELADSEGKMMVKSIVGRNEDYVVCKDGSKVQRLDFLLKGVANVKMSQLILDNKGILYINIVPEVGFSDADKKTVERNLHERVGKGNLDYRIGIIDEAGIKYTKRGKYKFLINLKYINSGRVIRRIVGRTDDYVICKDGSMVSRIDFIESGEHIKACQWVQEEIGKVTVLIVPDEDFTEKDSLFVKEATQKRVGVKNLDIEIKTVSWNDLLYTSRGKFKLIVNKNMKS